MKEMPTSHLNHHWKGPTWFKTKQYQNKIHHQLIHHITRIKSLLIPPPSSFSVDQKIQSLPHHDSWEWKISKSKTKFNSLMYIIHWIWKLECPSSTRTSLNTAILISHNPPNMIPSIHQSPSYICLVLLHSLVFIFRAPTNQSNRQTNSSLTHKKAPEMILIYGQWIWLTLRWDWSIHGNPLEQDSQWWLISVLLFLLISRWCPLLLLSTNWKASMCAPKLVHSPCSSMPPSPSGSISYHYHNSIPINQNSEQILQTIKQNHIKGMYCEKLQTASMNP